MQQKEIENIVIGILQDFCETYEINTVITMQTSLIGGGKILDSMGLVSVIVDIETAFLDIGIEISLTAEAAMSSRISPFRTVSSLCNFIAEQVKIVSNE
jgi:acyl carrier protein